MSRTPVRALIGNRHDSFDTPDSLSKTGGVCGSNRSCRVFTLDGSVSKYICYGEQTRGRERTQDYRIFRAWQLTTRYSSRSWPVLDVNDSSAA